MSHSKTYTSSRSSSIRRKSSSYARKSRNNHKVNGDIIALAEKTIHTMKKYTTYGETWMMELLKGEDIEYEFLKPFFIKDGNKICGYYIADFYIPSRKIVIDVEDNYRHWIKYDKYRIKDFMSICPSIKIYEWEMQFFHSELMIESLVALIKNAEN